MKSPTWIAPTLLGLSLLLIPAHAQEVGKGKDLSGQDLQKRDLRRENLDGANLAGANLQNADMTDAIMRKANLKEANLIQAKLTRADLSGSDLRLTKLQYTYLQKADLSGANLEGVDVQGASLQGCILRGANLRNAYGIQDITGADFTDADLRGAYLLAAIDYSKGAIFRGAKYDARTRWPKAFDVAASGAVLVATAEEPTPLPTTKAPAPPTAKTPAGTPKANLAAAPAAAATPAAAAKILDPNRPAAAPTEDAVKKILEKFWARDRVNNTFNYQSLKYGKPRKGEYRTDGIPANSDTMVFPVQAVCEQVVNYSDGTSQTELKSQQFVFFQSEFGQWTFRFKGNN
ncbi:MAG: pentapeptide repeat-containing protein [Opitutaceae bacterium]